jgi:protein pelota
MVVIIMNIIKLDRSGEIVFVPQTIEDLWVIKSISSEGDVIKGQSFRRQRVEETSESSRKHVFVAINIEKFDFSEELDSLRFTGIVVESNPSDLAPLGEHHTLEIKLDQKYILVKQQLFQHQIELLKDSSAVSGNRLIIVVLDNEQATIFEMSRIGIKEIAVISSGKSGKRYSQSSGNEVYFEKIFAVASKHTKDRESQLIIAGPGHVKSEFSNFLKAKAEAKGIKMIEVSIQNTSKSSIAELFTKKEISSFFEGSIIYEEQKFLSEFMMHLGKNDGKAAYGIKEVAKAIEQGSAESILISENLWKSDVNKIQEFIKRAESLKIKVHIVDSKHDTIKALDSFGGIIAVLRYSIDK